MVVDETLRAKLELFVKDQTAKGKKSLKELETRLKNIAKITDGRKLKAANKELSKIGVTAESRLAKTQETGPGIKPQRETAFIDDQTRKILTQQQVIEKAGKIQQKQTATLEKEQRNSIKTQEKAISNKQKLDKNALNNNVKNAKKAEREKEVALQQGVERKLNFNQKFNKQATLLDKQRTSELKKRLDTQTSATEAGLEKSKKSIFNFNRAMGALSFLFIGQQIQRTMQRILSSTVSTFTELTKSQTEAGRAVTALGANFKFLQFSIGNALATGLIPLLPRITEIFNSIAEFIQENPNLTLKTSLGVLLTGFTFSTVAQGLLGLAGLKALLGAEAFATFGLVVVPFAIGLGLIINDFTFDSVDDSFNAGDIGGIIGGGLIGASIGFKVIGGIRGVGIGFSVGTAIILAIKAFRFAKAEGLPLTFGRIALALFVGILGGIAGFFFGGGVPGAIIGFSLGTALVFTIETILFKNKDATEQIKQESERLLAENKITQPLIDAQPIDIFNAIEGKSGKISTLIDENKESINNFGNDFVTVGEDSIFPVLDDMTTKQGDYNETLFTTNTNISDINDTAIAYSEDGSLTFIEAQNNETDAINAGNDSMRIKIDLINELNASRSNRTNISDQFSPPNRDDGIGTNSR